MQDDYPGDAIDKLNNLLSKINSYCLDYFGRSFFNLKEKRQELARFLNLYLKECYFDDLLDSQYIWKETQFRQKQVKKIVKNIDRLSIISNKELEDYLDAEIHYQRQTLVRYRDQYFWRLEGMQKANEEAIFSERLILLEKNLYACLMRYEEILLQPYSIFAPKVKLNKRIKNYLIERMQLFVEILCDLSDLHKEYYLQYRCMQHLENIVNNNDNVAFLKVSLLLDNSIYDLGRYAKYQLNKLNKNQHKVIFYSEENIALSSLHFSKMLNDYERFLVNLVSHSAFMHKNATMHNFMSSMERNNSVRNINAFKSALSELHEFLSLDSVERKKLENCLKNLEIITHSNDTIRLQMCEWLNQQHHFYPISRAQNN